MVHPVQAYLFILERTLVLTLLLMDRTRNSTPAGVLADTNPLAPGPRRRDDTGSFLGVLAGAKDVPILLHPPSGKVIEQSKAAGR